MPPKTRMVGGMATQMSEDDEWETPPATTLRMVELLPQGGAIWEPFCGPTLQSVNTLRETMHEVVYDAEQDFFALAAPPCEHVVVVTNPPFTRKIDAVERLCMWGVPFAMVLPVDAVNQVAFKKRVARLWGHDLQVVYPPAKVHFMKNGMTPGRSPFHVIFLLYKCPPLANAWLRDE
jgi:hypothetical protein